MKSCALAAFALVALIAFPRPAICDETTAAKPAALDEIPIPDTDVNFGEKQSLSHRPPPTGPLLHRAFAQRWKDSFEANAAKAGATIARAGSGDCGNRAQRNAAGWQDVLDSAYKEAARGELKQDTVPQIAARHYMRASNMADKLIKGAASTGCPAQ